MNFVETVAPISIENLKKYFTDKTTFFIIDYKNSTLKGTKLLTYLSNLDVPCDISFNGCDDNECMEMVKDYFNTSVLVKVPSLEKTAISVLLQSKSIIPLIDSSFIENNQEILNKWTSKLESLTVYNMSIIGEAFNDFVDSFEKDESSELTGVNFVNLLKYESFYPFYSKIEKDNLKYYTRYFNDYMFKGKNLYSYWANENNPMFLLTVGIADGKIEGESYADAAKQTLEEITNATPV